MKINKPTTNSFRPICQLTNTTSVNFSRQNDDSEIINLDEALVTWTNRLLALEKFRQSLNIVNFILHSYLSVNITNKMPFEYDQVINQ